MKHFKRLILSLIIMVLLGTPVFAQGSQGHDVYGDNYSVDIFVREDGSVDFDIDLTVTFNEQRQGIYFTVPQKDTKDFVINGEEVKREYFFPVDSISSSTHEIDVDSDRTAVTIRMGTQGVFLEGRQNFNLKYTIHTRELNLNGLDMFYFDLLPGVDRDYVVGNLEYTIRFEKPVSGSYFVYNPNNDTQEYTLSNNEIKGSYNKELARETVTVEVPLGNDYFTFPRVDYVKDAFILGVGVAVLILLGYVLFGKDPIVVESVEFGPPEGISSAEVGYIYRGITTSKDIVSLIVYWASKGFIKIIEEDGDITLEKIQDLPANWNIEEIRLFRKIFGEETQVTLSSLDNKIGETVLHLQASVPSRFTKDKSMHIYDRKSSMIKLLSIFLLPLIPGAMGYAVVLLETSYTGDAMVGFFVGYGIFFILSVIGSSILAFDRVYKVQSRIINTFLILGPVFLIGITLASIFGAKDNSVYVISSLLVYSIALFFAANTSRRTQKGADWVGQIRGLKRFIQVAEKDRLIQLVEETPYIFYDILPYAYVLGVTDIWTKKFESIAVQAPDWYVSSNPNLTTFMMMNHLNRSMSSMSSTLTSIPVSSGSGGGSFGGGGGGGFSGGGFGGGGSGSW